MLVVLRVHTGDVYTCANPRVSRSFVRAISQRNDFSCARMDAASRGDS